LFSKYYASVIIENSREPSYFTEKITDTVLAGAIPIYWGAPNIGDFFNENGIITFSSANDLIANKKYINQLSNTDLLKERAENYHLATKQLDHRSVIRKKILSFLEKYNF